MPDDHIVYSFEGDITDLSAAVDQALALLDKFQKSGELYLQKFATATKNSTALRAFEANLKRTAAQIDAFKQSLAGVDPSAVGQLGVMSQAPIQTLSTVISTLQQNTSLTSAEFAALGTQLQTVQNEFNLLTLAAQGDSQALQQLGIETQAAAQQITAATNATREKMNADNQAAEATDKQVKATQEQTKSSKDATSEFGSQQSAAKRLNAATRELSNTTKTLTSGFNALSNASRKVTRAFTFLRGVLIGKLWASTVKESIAYVETLNLFRVAMDDSREAASKFVETMQELYGLDPEVIMRHAAQFYNLAAAIGAPTEAAESISLGLTHLGADMASLFNMPVDKVMDDLTSGMQGMTRAVRKYGIDLRATTLEATALTLGLKVNARTLSEADRQGLRYITIMRQARTSVGDYARTIESAENQVKVFQEQIRQLGRAIGNFFVNSIGKVLPYINGFIMALRTALTYIAALFGFEYETFGDSGSFGKGAAESVNSIGQSADGATKKLKKMRKQLTSFDELHILSEPDSEADSGGGGGGGGGVSIGEGMDPTILAAVQELERQFENVRMKANDVRDAILEFMGFSYAADGGLVWSLDQLLQNLSNLTGLNFGPLGVQLSALWESLKNLASVAFESLSWAWNNILVPLGQWAISEALPAVVNLLAGAFDFLAGVLEALQPTATWLWDNLLQPIAEWTGGVIVTVLNEIGDALSVVGDWVAEHEPLISALAITIGSFAAAWYLVNGAITLWNAVAAAGTAVTTGLGTAIAFLTSPVGIAIAIIGALIAVAILLWKNWDEVKAWLLKIWNAIKTAATNTWNAVKNFFVNTWNNIKTGVTNAWNSIKNWIVNLWNGLKSTATNVWNAVKNFFVNTWNSIKTGVTNAWNSIKNWIVGLWKGLKSTATNVWNSVKNFFANTWNGIKTGVINVWNSIKNWIVGLWKGLKSDATNVWNAVKNFFVNTWNSIKTGVTNVWNGIKNWIMNLWNGLKSAATNVFNAVRDGIVGAFNAVKTKISNIWTSIWNTIKGFINKVISGVNSMIRGLNKLQFKAPDWVPFIGGKSFGIHIREIPYLASGAVVTKPTIAMIGEGAYDEAVIPLGQSPQMKDLIRQIADAVAGSRQSGVGDMVVPIYISGQKVDEVIIKGINRSSKRVGTTRVVI